MQGRRLAILEHARRHGAQIDEFVEASARASPKPRRRADLMSTLKPGNRLVVNDLSRLGRSLGQTVAMLDILTREGIAFIAIAVSCRLRRPVCGRSRPISPAATG